MATGVVFRLLKRHESPADAPAFEEGWTGRLHAVGRALDEYDSPFRDLAIVTTGHDVWITALGYHTGRYHAAWAPLTLWVEDDDTQYVTAEPIQIERPRPAGWSVVKETVPWTTRLRALGVLLDRLPSPLRDVVVLDVDGGFVVQGRTRSASAEGETWVGATHEVTAREIAAVNREVSPAVKVRVVRLRQVGLG
jgi:hypothetical protein